MKVIDIISEAKQATISKRQSQSSRGISIYGDKERADSTYVAFKLGQAMAMADGSGKPLDIDAKSWHGKKKTTQPYTELEQAMFQQAAKASSP